MLRHSFPLLLSLAVSIALAGAAETPTFEQSLSNKSVSSAEISPDGKYVAYLVTQADWDENDFVSQIWVAVTATGETFQLTSGKKSSTAPQWSPDSKRLAFISCKPLVKESALFRIPSLRLSEQVVPMFPESWLDKEVVAPIARISKLARPRQR